MNMEKQILDFWFEIFQTNEDESTETVYSTESMKEAIDYANEKDLQVDLWIIDSTVSSLPMPIMRITETTTLGEIDNVLLDCENASQDLREIIVEKLNYQFPLIK